MVNTIQTNIYKVTLLLVLAFCLGGASKLYAAQNDEIDDKKEDMPDTAQDSSPNDADNEAGGSTAIEWNEKHQVDWNCDSIKSCKAVITIMGCLEYWQKVTNDMDQLGAVFQYLSASNNYRDIVGAYHHVLEKHLEGKKNKEAFQLINGRLQQHITCNFAKCKGYDRNQRDREKEAAEKDEIEKYGKEAIFIRDTLDTIHAYLVHGSDSGHRYSPSKHKPHKVHKRPKNDSDDEKEATYTLFDEKMAALRKWQGDIKKKNRNQKKNKFITKIADKVKKNDVQKMSLALLKAKFGQEKAFIIWLGYLKDNQCDTDCILEEIEVDNEKGTVIPIDHILFDRIKKYIQENPADGKKTASYGFGVRLYYWERYKISTSDDWNFKEGRSENFSYNPGYKHKDLYVAPIYPSFKNEMLAKKNITISKWNQKMYAAKLMLAQSATLKKLKAYDVIIGDIEYGAGLSIWHLLSIIFYTNFTALCTTFGESLRYLSPSESLKKLMQRNSKWHYLSRYLREVVDCFGTHIDGSGADGSSDIHGIRGDTYYHGVSYLLFTQFSVHWYGPLSTSKQIEVATLFTTSTNNGLLLELKEDHPKLRFFNVSLLSCFSSEDERLFMGGDWPIQIATIRILEENINLQEIMHALFIVHSMIKGGKRGDEEKALRADAAIYKGLIETSSDIPTYAQHIWNAFRHQQRRITINMEKMYGDYQAFIPLLCTSDPKLKNLLLLDKIAQLFPNVTEIICAETDCVGVKDNHSRNGIYSADIVCSNFILGVQERLSKLDKQAKLTKIVIQTAMFIKDSCNLYAPQFGALGWQIGRGCDCKIIVLTKEPYDVMYKEVIPKIKSMIQGARRLSDRIPPSLDVPIFKQLIAGSKDIPADVQKQWGAFRHQQQGITIDMSKRYGYFQAFMPLLCDPKLKNLLLLDTITQLFPNVTEIICRETDCIKGDKYGFSKKYSADIVCSNFILGVKYRLSKIDKHAKLTTIVIKTYLYRIKDDCKLYAPQFGALGWKVQTTHRKQKISFTKISPNEAMEDIFKNIVKEGIIPHIASLIAGKSTDDSKLTSASCMPIFKKLIVGEKDIPADVQKLWDKFRHQQKRITINMTCMHRNYQAFMPLLCSSDPKFKNVLLLDKLVELFPNVIEIICTATDYVGKDVREYKPDKYGFSSSIVSASFILGLKGMLSKIDKHAKLTKLVIQTNKYEIEDDCNLYPTQFESLGWDLQKAINKQAISLTKLGSDAMHKGVIAKIKFMIKKGHSYKATSLDMLIFNKLIVGTKNISADVQKEWTELRHQQQCITINMYTMYAYYKMFIPLLFDKKSKNLLLLDKIVQLFPNLAEIICAATDCIGVKYNQSKRRWEREYSSDIVSSNFILGVKDCLGKMDKHAKLTKVVIQTNTPEIGDSCMLYAKQFDALGWDIGKGCDGNTIVVTKESYDVLYKGVIPKISAMIQGKELSYNIPPAPDVPIFKQLIAGSKDIPADVQKQWHAFRHQQQRITINMEYMHEYYKAFIPLFFDPKLQHLLLLDKIVQLFPNVTEIICKQTDYIKYENYSSKYSAAIVCSNFILGVKDRLSKMDKHAKLTKIVIQTSTHVIGDSCMLYAKQFDALGWHIGKGSMTIVVTKEPYGVRCKDAITKIKFMIQPERLLYEATSLDVPILKQLIVGGKEIPADVQKQWDAFRHQQQRITINMYAMYLGCKAFIPLFVDPKVKNLLLLDKIAKLFPNVIEIICKMIDVDIEKKECFAGIVCSNFILGVKDRLSKMDKHEKLTKIIIQTWKHEIKDDCKLYATQFGTLGWKVQRESYKNGETGTSKKNNQITLTRLKAPNASLPKESPASSEVNENKPNDHQLADNAVFDLD